MRIVASFFLVLLNLVLLSGCASIAGDKSQPVTIRTTCDGEELSGATCNLINSKGSYVLKTPGTVSVNKSFGDMTIDCKKGDSAGAVAVKSSSSGLTWGNIILGGGIGALVDMKTGAGYNYQNSIVVNMMGSCSVEQE